MSSQTQTKALVTTEWIAEHAKDSGLRLVEVDVDPSVYEKGHIEGAVGWLEARTRAEHDAGDHTFFIGDVVAIEHGPAKSALMYRESTYHRL